MSKYIVFIFLLLLSLTADSAEISYTPLNDVVIKTHQREYVQVLYKDSWYKIDLEFYSQKDVYKFDYVKSSINKASRFIFKFAETKNVYNNTECVGNSHLEVYDIEWSVLNNDSRFVGKFAPTNGGKLGVQAIYDPRIYELGLSSIIISSTNRFGEIRGNDDKFIILAHELSHYWYHRLCFNKRWPGEPEEFAVGFENFYFEESRR